MDFLDTVTDGIENAVGAVLAPVADTAGAAAGTLRRELTRTWQGVFGSPTPPGGTNWNAYSHQELYAMVRGDADPGQVGEQSAVLEGLGRGAYDCADELASRRRQVAQAWQGQASGAFDSTLGEHSAGGAAVAEHATAMSAAVLRAAEALSRAQARMPEPVDVGAATSYGAVAGGAVAGPAFALGSVSGAGASWFGASLMAANKKAEAVEVMQTFEQSLVAADPPDAPAKLPPGVPGGVPLPVPRPESPVVAAVPGPAVPAVARTGTARAATSGSAAPASRTAPVPGTAAPGTAAPDSAAPGSRTVSASAGTSAGQAGFAGGQAPGPAQPPGGGGSPVTPSSADVVAGPRGGQTGGRSGRSTGDPAVVVGGRPDGRTGWASGQDGRAGGLPVAWRELVGRGAVPGLLTDTERPVRGGAHGAVPANSRRDEDREHHNRMPRADRLFALDDKTPPPVIGA